MRQDDAKSRIINATLNLIEETETIDKITVRQVAERANVGVGLINYHFDSKNGLLSTAIAELMAKMATGFLTSDHSSALPPLGKLKNMVKELFSFAEKHEKLITFTITQNLVQGEMKTPLFLVPVLQEVFGNQKDQMELRIIALQILLPIQVASINPEEFRLYTGIDLYDEKQRNQYIDALIDNLVNPAGSGV